MTDAAARNRAVAKLERRLNRRLDLRAAVDRGLNSLPAAAQIVVAATLSYVIARYLFGHELPLIAVTVTVSILGFARDARPRRVFDTTVGILTGIVLSELLLRLFGTGVWQLAVVLFVTLVVSRLISPNPAFAVTAGIQSILVLMLPAPEGGVFVRSLDGLIGGVVALAVTALVPRDPRRIAARDSRRMVSALAEALDSAVRALEEARAPAATLALDRLRRTQGYLDDWAQSLESAVAISRISPFLRRHLPALRHQARVLAALDLASRHLRVVTRRISFLVRDGEPRPALAALLRSIAEAIALLGRSLDDPAYTSQAREVLLAILPKLDPSVSLPGARMPASIVVHLLRPLVVDLLVATGLGDDEAHALLPAV